MDKKINSVVIIGLGLALLYATSCLVFLQYLNIPGFEGYTLYYGVLFGALCACSLAVIALREWGRKLLIVLNAAMIVLLALQYLPKVDLIPLGYLFLNIIVLLYFTQTKIKWQFCSGRSIAWNKSILIVDDDETLIKTLRPLLLSNGYAVLTALSGEDGLQIAQVQNPDLILLDVILPGIKGREVCQKLKQDPRTRDIPVVFITAKDSPEDIQAEKEAGASGHVTKPINIKVLIETVQDALGSRKARK